MPQFNLQFQVEVIEDQRQLNGARYVSLEGPGDEEAQGWAIALNYGQSKDASLEEADLALTGPNGGIFAGLESGKTDIVTDDVSGDEHEMLELTLRISGGDGDYADAAGEVRLCGDILAGGGRITVSA